MIMQITLIFEDWDNGVIFQSSINVPPKVKNRAWRIWCECFPTRACLGFRGVTCTVVYMILWSIWRSKNMKLWQQKEESHEHILE